MSVLRSTREAGADPLAEMHGVERSREALPSFKWLRYTAHLKYWSQSSGGREAYGLPPNRRTGSRRDRRTINFSLSHRRSEAFWRNAVGRLPTHATPAGLPKYGYALQAGEAIVGVILLIFARVQSGAGEFVRCSLSSWYVEEPFRVYAPLLISRALRHREVTYFNLTAVPHTFPILKAQGFTSYCSGRFMALPWLARGPSGTTVARVAAGGCAGDGLPRAEAAILESHAGYGCISLVCHHSGKAYPFVFAPRRKFGIASFALLAYCRGVDDFVRFAGPLGRHLLLRDGLTMVAVDADGPIDALVGHYSADKPKYFLGPNPPRPGDMAYSERTMFGS